MNSTPLVLLHGFPFDHTLWDEVLAELPGINAFVPDLPGFGSAPLLDEKPSLESLADDVAKMLNSRNISRCALAGMSMGGYVALAFAERHPDRLAALALVSTQAQADTDEARNQRYKLIEKTRSEGPKIVAETMLPKLFSTRNGVGSKTERLTRDGAEKSGVAGLTWALEAMARRPDRTTLLETLAVPSVVIHGKEDKIIPEKRALAIHRHLEHGKYVALSGAGHMTPVDDPGGVATALREWLDRVGREVYPSRKSANRSGLVWGPTDRGL
jgi:pimeloyl-ACP methyl ester carboxylesterase